MKWLVLGLVLALAAPAFAGGFINEAAVATDSRTRSIHNTFYKSIGDCEVNCVYSDSIALGDEPLLAGTIDDTAHVNFGSGGMPGWLMVTIPEEATLTVGFIRFKEAVDGATFGYTWGDWALFYIGAAQYDGAFNVGLWDSCQIQLAGSGLGLVDVYWRMELISAD